jgi:gamma-glutamylcysteine synthetase
MERIVNHVIGSFREAESRRGRERRVGAELKFPFVDASGRAASEDDVAKLWEYLGRRGWRTRRDAHSGRIVGASRPGPQNDSLASCETGFCKTEFSLAHVADLHELAGMTEELRELLRDFSDERGAFFLGLGIHPVTPPSGKLVMKKGRNVFWDKVFGSNRHIPEGEGDDVHLFTVSASSQVHIDVAYDEAVRAVNVFNGLAAPQIALTANSSIWKGGVDSSHKCVGEMFWDWWIPGSERYGVPRRPFQDMEDYVSEVAKMRPVYVKREGVPIGLLSYDSFYDYYRTGAGAVGVDPEGRPVELTPHAGDIDQHGTFYWYNARISRYYTLENRVNDQQPPEDLPCIAALTLGLMSALDEAEAVVRARDWEALAAARTEACRHGIHGSVDGLSLAETAAEMLDAAEEGLKRRGLGEEGYLAPLRERLKRKVCPADTAEEIFRAGGMELLVRQRRI